MSRDQPQKQETRSDEGKGAGGAGEQGGVAVAS